MANIIERGYYGTLGIRKEFPGLNPVAALLFIVKSEIYSRKHGSITEGHLPQEGAAILTGNHHREGDIYKTVQAARITAGRLPTRTVVRRSLVYPNSRESEDYLASIGNKQDDLNEYNSLRAFVLKGVGVMPIIRDNPGRDFIRQSDEVLKTNQLLGIFLQPTRYEDCLLRNLQDGAAFFARRHPDVPVYPLAFSGPPDGPDKVVILQPFTYTQKVQELGRKISIGEFTMIIADTVAAGLPERSQQDWKTTRGIELARLTSPRIAA